MQPSFKKVNILCLTSQVMQSDTTLLRGSVNWVSVIATAPGIDFQAMAPFFSRGFGPANQVADGAKDAGNQVADTGKQVATTAAPAAETAGNAVGGAASTAVKDGGGAAGVRCFVKHTEFSDLRIHAMLRI